ncbi:MAG: formamidopyrimidine-DNA glycosylase [Actinobacteria bacterium RBG_13_63_9]|nr:MAG: formamidopyrimidine-DNA glycosylase [Actinobacteria bacterium RBG_13_63_9]
MPEMPDIEAYLEALRPRVQGTTLLGVRLKSAFLVRTFDPPLAALTGGQVEGVSRLGKRVVFEVVPSATGPAGCAGPARPAGPGGPVGSSASWFLVLHLMVAGRLHWKAAGAAVPRGSGLAAFDFAEGTLILTEAGKKRRASLHLVTSGEALGEFDPGGLEVFDSGPAEFGAVLRRENHTLKRALTDPRIVSGIGNAYSDEILHRACLSPFKLTQALSSDDLDRLHQASVMVLREWTERLKAKAREGFPEKVTAFRPEMAVHGRFGAACPVCGTAVQRIVYADNECDYCPGCQTEGRVLADRSLSRLLRDDWPRHVAGREGLD